MASSSWLPAHGRHQVSIGTSLRRALKARKANGDQPSSGAAKRIPDRDFYAFRYNFKPNSIDADKPGGIDIRKTTDSTSITVKYPSKQNGETHVFKGSENVAKEWDCVLVYDEELGTFTLEKLDSHAALTHERKPIAARPPPPASPKPAKVKDELEAELEGLLDLADPDADAEGEDDFEEIIPKQVTYRKEEEEEDPLEELIPPTPPVPPKQPPPPRPPKAQTKASAKESQPPRADKPPGKAKGKVPAVPRPPSSTLPSAKPPPKQKQAAAAPAPAQTPTVAPTPTPAPAPPPAAPPKAQPQSKAPRKREAEPAPHLSDGDEEVLEFGKPAKRTRKMSPAAPVSSGLALPGTSSSVAPPPAPSASSSSSASSGRPLAAPGGGGGGGVPQQQHAGYALLAESESEGEWSEVDPEAEAEAAIQDDDIFGDGGQGDEEVGADMDEDEFEAELKMEMEMAEMEQEQEAGETRGAPMSLNDYARGVAGLSDEDTSSSDDSDDD